MQSKHQKLSEVVLSYLVPKTEVEKLVGETVRGGAKSLGDSGSPASCRYDTKLGWLQVDFWVYGNTEDSTNQDVLFHWNTEKLFCFDGVDVREIKQIGNEAFFYKDENNLYHFITLKGNIIISIVITSQIPNPLKTAKGLACKALQELNNYTS